MIAVINHQRAIQIKFHDHSWLFHHLLKKLSVDERLFRQLGTRFSGHCRCIEVSARANVWTVSRDKSSWPLQRGGRQWRFDCKQLLDRFGFLKYTLYSNSSRPLNRSTEDSFIQCTGPRPKVNILTNSDQKACVRLCIVLNSNPGTFSGICEYFTLGRS